MVNGEKSTANVGRLTIRVSRKTDSLPGTWIIEGNDVVTRGVIVVSYLFVCSFAITMGPGT